MSQCSNHAQGFAYSCKKLQAKRTAFMPVTPQQKVQHTKRFGEDYIEIKWIK